VIKMSSEMNEMSIEYVRKLGTDELCKWLRIQLDEDDWVEAEMVVRKQKIKGKNFLNYSKADWKADGLPGGIADSLVQIAQGVSGSGASSVDGIVDVSFQLYNDLTTPFNSEPNLEELPAFLLTDPPVQFPVQPPIFKILESIVPFL
jgi:hypothetical protein